MIYSSPQNLLNSSGTRDLLDEQSRQWGMASSLLLLIVLLFMFTQNSNKLASLASKSSDVQNVVNLEYRIVPPEPKPTPASPPELVESVPEEEPPSPEPEPEPVLQEVQKIVPEPPPVVKEIVKEMKKVTPIKAVQEKRKPSPKPPAEVSKMTTPSEPVRTAAEVIPEPAAYEQTQVDSIPAALSKDEPEYPRRARRMNVTGFVEIRFLVNKKGRVEKLEILNAKPVGTFDKSVRKTVMSWRFNPGMKNNRLVATWMTTTINFELE